MALASDAGTELSAVDRTLETLEREKSDGTLREAAVQVLRVTASRVSGRELNTTDDIAAWLLGISDKAPLARLLLHASSSSLDEPLESSLLLLVARRLAHSPMAPLEITDAKVTSLDHFLVDTWKRERAKSPHEWLYHPRRTNISGLVIRRFLADLMGASSRLRVDAEQGRIAVDLNVGFSADGRNKTLDCVLGLPTDTLGAAIEIDNPFRKARLDKPIITVEVKACMTAHRQANSRLIDELHSSVEVVKTRDRRVIPVAIVIVNVSPTFTNPLNLPGPNKHVPREVARVFERVVQRVKLDGGTGTEIAYGGIALVVVDIDNERRIRNALRDERVPSTHTYERTVGRVVALYERRIKVG